MRCKKVVDGRNCRVGYKFSFTDPLTGRRKRKTIQLSKRNEAQRAMLRYLEDREKEKYGIPNESIWNISFRELAETFLRDAPIRSERRRNRLAILLRRNVLGLRMARDLNNRANLHRKTMKMANERGEGGNLWVARAVQGPLKQMTRWAASAGVLPMDPLAFWTKLPRKTSVKHRRAFSPAEMREVLVACEDYDRLEERVFPFAAVVKTLLVSGNRPCAVFAARVCDLTPERIVLPPGNGNKRNGRSFIPPEWVDQLRKHVSACGDADLRAPLLRSPLGAKADGHNCYVSFKKVMTLAFVRMCWPMVETEVGSVNPLDVAFTLSHGRPRGRDGVPATNPVTIMARTQWVETVKAIAAKLKPEVDRMLTQRSLYSLKATHITWARQLAPTDAVLLQVGHADSSINGRHYLDMGLVDARQSPLAVWEVLKGERQLPSETNPRDRWRRASGMGR